MKRIISILLSALMVVMIIPVSVFMVSAEAGDVNTLYANEFDTELNPNGGSKSGDVTIETNTGAQNGTYYLDTKGMRVGGGASWTEPVALDNNSGELVIKMRYYNNNNNGTALSINGVAIAGGTSSGIPTIGGVNAADAAKAWRVITLTVTISDLSTGAATVKMEDIWGSYSGTATVGKITDSITIKIGSFGNSFKVDSLTVTQVHVEEEPDQPDQPDPEPQGPAQLYYNEFDVAMNPNGGTPNSCQRVDDATNGLDGKVMQVFGNGSWTEPVALNNATGTVTLEMRFYNNNFVNGTTLSINGVAIFGADGNAKPKIGDTIVRDAQSAYRLNTLTVVIEDLSTGVANVSWVDQYGNKANGTVTLGAISDSFVITLGSYPNSFKVDYIKVIQEVPAAPETECNVWIDGFQKTDVDGGKYNVRFVAGVGELVAGQTVIGFEIAVPAQSKSWDKVTSTVYNSITANYGTKTVLASEIGAEYVTAIAITGIPADLGEVVFTVRPYTVINGETVYGEEVTVTVTP